MKTIIYLDNASTTKPRDNVIKKMAEVAEHNFGNPSSLHTLGYNSEKEIKAASRIISEKLNVKSGEIIFTSGGTESNNLAILGYLKQNKRAGNKIITSSVEHPSVLNVFKHLGESGYETVYCPCDSSAGVDLDFLEKAVDENTALVSLMNMNNEIGTISPVDRISKIIKNKNAVFHVDAVQSFCKIPVDVSKIGCDMLSISAHKIHGPKGVGALYIKSGVKVAPLFYGGGQQGDLRSGTQNVEAIAGFGEAVKTGFDMEKTAALKARLVELIIQNIDDYEINSPGEDCSGNILNISFPGIRSEVLLHHLSKENIYVSSGSACGSNKKSYVLEQMGKKPEIIDSAIRFSLSDTNTVEEIDYTAAKLKEIIEKLRMEN